MEYKSEDVVRQEAQAVMGLVDTPTARAGVGQLTSWAKLGFEGVKGAPDGWYLPNAHSFPAIVAEFKSNTTALRPAHVEELERNVAIVRGKYSKVVGVLWNGVDVIVLKDGERLKGETTLRNKEYYLGLFAANTIDRQRIYVLTKRINDSLHFNFGVKNLYHRMIFTACALVAKRYGAVLCHGMTFDLFSLSIRDTLARSYSQALQRNGKLALLLEVYSEIKMNVTNNQAAIDNFIDDVVEISDNLNSDFWNGEDVMAIFFNEFNRYKKKSERGQVFTPDHITSLMFRVADVRPDDVVLDAACGSGAFLVKAMCNMIKEAGGVRAAEAETIRRERLFGIEIDREVFALACANMLIHNDGKTSIANMDSTLPEAALWMRGKGVTKVLMNPPFENKYGCLDIVENVLANVGRAADCLFILPDNKLEKNRQQAQRILKNNTLSKIVKLPADVFPGVATAVFVFKAGIPHDFTKRVFACHIPDDGLETVKNQGRQDLRNAWSGIEDYWVDVIYRKAGDDSICWIDARESLTFPRKRERMELTSADVNRAILKYLLYKRGIDEQEYDEAVLSNVLYGVPLPARFRLEVGSVDCEPLDMSRWRPFAIGSLFTVRKGSRLTKSEMVVGDINYIGATAFNNGVTNHIANNGELHSANSMTVCYNGSIGEAFFQEAPFWATDDVNVLYPLFALNVRRALFLAALFRMVGKSFSYNDKWTKEKMEQTSVLLPPRPDGTPDWEWVDAFVASLAYGRLL